MFGNLLLGALLSLTSAAFFGMNATSVRRGVLTGTVLQGLSISFGFGLPFFILMSVVLGSFQQIWNFSNFSYALLNYDNLEYTTRHSPVLLMMISLLVKLNFTDEFIRLIYLHLN